MYSSLNLCNSYILFLTPLIQEATIIAVQNMRIVLNEGQDKNCRLGTPAWFCTKLCPKNALEITCCKVWILISLANSPFANICAINTRNITVLFTQFISNPYGATSDFKGICFYKSTQRMLNPTIYNKYMKPNCRSALQH